MRKNRAPKKTAPAKIKAPASKRLPTLQPGTAKKVERLLREITGLLHVAAMKAAPVAAKPAPKAKAKAKAKPQQKTVAAKKPTPKKRREMAERARKAAETRKRNREAARDMQAAPSASGQTLEVAHG